MKKLINGSVRKTMKKFYWSLGVNILARIHITDSILTLKHITIIHEPLGVNTVRYYGCNLETLHSVTASHIKHTLYTQTKFHAVKTLDTAITLFL